MISLLDMLGWSLLLLVAGLGIWAYATIHRSTMDIPEMVLAAAVRYLPQERRDWGTAMMVELAQVTDLVSRWRFALGGARVALLPPSRPGRFGVNGPGFGMTVAVLAGVAGCIAMTAYAIVTHPGAMPVFPAPQRRAAASADDPLYVMLVAFGVLLVGYLCLAFALPRVSSRGRWTRRIGALAALLFSIALATESFTGSGYDDIGYALPTILVLFPVASALAAAAARSVSAGMEAALWAGLLSALAFVTIATSSTLHIVRAGTDPAFLDEFMRSNAADLAGFQTYAISEHLGAGVIMLALLPAWALLLGLIGSAIGRAIGPRHPASS